MIPGEDGELAEVNREASVSKPSHKLSRFYEVVRRVLERRSWPVRPLQPPSRNRRFMGTSPAVYAALTALSDCDQFCATAR